jgi:tetratricopeptide (TPR) repeat protein
MDAWDMVYYYNLPNLKDISARIYQRKGEFNKAIAEYERLITIDPGSKDRRFIYPKFHYRLAKLYQEKGLSAKAISQYEKFLDIWKDADKDLPELIDATALYQLLKALM